MKQIYLICHNKKSFSVSYGETKVQYSPVDDIPVDDNGIALF